MSVRSHLLGMIIAPTWIVLNTPLECTICLGKNCKDAGDGTGPFGQEPGYSYTDPGYSRWWAKKYCTFSNDHLGHFDIYFPFILIVTALALVFIERGFDRCDLDSFNPKTLLSPA